MYVSNKERLTTVVKIGAVLVVVLYLFYIIFIITLVGIGMTANALTRYTNYTISEIFFVIAFFISFTALVISQVLNKEKWPVVEGHIMDSRVSLGPIDIIRQHGLKFTYLFDYMGHSFIKEGFSKLDFATEAEVRTYLQKHTVDTHATIPIHVFKYYPKWSANNIKINFTYLIYVSMVIITNAMLILFGFIFRIAGTHDLTPAIKASSPQIAYQYLQTIILNYLARIDITALILPTLILFMVILFIWRSLGLFIHNKMSFLSSGINPKLIMEEIKFQRITEIHCVNCNAVNDVESIFCLNCGAKLQ